MDPIVTDEMSHETVNDVDMRARAVALARLGYRIFRLEPDGRRPIEKNFPQVATKDPAKVAEMWSGPFGEPTYHNIGIATGHGLVAVDYDVKDGKPGLAHRDVLDAKGMPESGRTFTPSGGQHLLLRLPERIVVGSSVQKIAPGVDTRGHNGYVIAPGSRLSGDGDGPPIPNDARPWHGWREYRWEHERHAADLDTVPEWFMPTLLAKSSFRDSPSSTTPLVDLDSIEAIVRATRFLVDEAPTAVEGNAGDHTTFRVAARVRDFGISEEIAFSLMIEHWNPEKAVPPWDLDALERKVRNAYQYGKDAPGAAHPLADFDKVDGIPALPPSTLAALQPFNPDWPAPTLLDAFDPADLAVREFLFEGLFARGTVSALVAPSGAGKTQWLAQAALALATGRKDIAGFTPVKPATTWIWNQEDDTVELQRRIGAAMGGLKLDFADIGGRLFVDSGVERRLVLAGRDPRTGTIRPTKHVAAMIAGMKARGVDLLVIDPLVEFHEAQENDNTEMAAVASVLRRIAVEANAAVVVGVHDRKPDQASSAGHVGNQHSMRGASSVQGVTRLMLTLYGMSSEDAKAARIAEEDRHRYLRIDGAKNNLALTGGDPLWLKREGHALREGDGRSEVGFLRPVGLATRSRVRVEIDRHELVAKAIALLDMADGEWHGWADVRRCLSDENVWPEGQALSDITWKRWMADEPGGATPTARGVLHVRKHAGRGGVQIRLTGGADSVCAAQDSSDGDI